MIKQTVNASKKYDVIISDGKKDFKAFLPLFGGKNILILTDDNVFNLYKDYFDGVFTDKNVYYYVIPHGEESKNLTEYAKIAEFLAKNNFTRSDSLIAFGGGVTGDLGGFLAATFRLRFYQPSIRPSAERPRSIFRSVKIFAARFISRPPFI